jgi:LacI family transcriptional regulator
MIEPPTANLSRNTARPARPYDSSMPDSSDSRPTRAATVRDVARLAGVSPATVSRVLTGNRAVSPDIQARVHRAIRELDYVVNEQARALSATNSKTVAILLDHLSAPFYNRIASGVEQEAAERGRLSLVCTTNGDPGRELAQIEMLRARNTEAVVLIGAVHDTKEYRSRIARLAKLLDASGSGLVLIGRPSPVENLPVTVIEYDNEGGAYAAVSHLLSKGHRRIAYLGPDPARNSTSATRIAGYHRAFAAHGIEADPYAELTARSGTESRTLGYTALSRLLESGDALPFTALFCFDDLVAAGAMAALREAGVSIPEDISIVGYNDEPTSLDVVPALTTVHIPHVELGRTAMRLVLDRDDQTNTTLGHHTTLGTYLVLRDSVCPATI